MLDGLAEQPLAFTMQDCINASAEYFSEYLWGSGPADGMKPCGRKSGLTDTLGFFLLLLHYLRVKLCYWLQYIIGLRPHAGEDGGSEPQAIQGVCKALKDKII